MIAALQQEQREQTATISQFMSSGIDLSEESATGTSASSGLNEELSASLQYIELKRKQQETAKSQLENAAKFTFTGPKPKATAKSALLSHIETAGLVSEEDVSQHPHRQHQHLNRKKTPRAAASARPKLQAAKKQRGTDYADRLSARIVSKKSKLKAGGKTA